MRRCQIGALMISLCLLLSSCSGGEVGGSKAEELALNIRTEYLAMTACTAELALTADYGQRVYNYGVAFSWHKDGETVLTLTAPENVAGITARIANGKTALEYEGVRVETGDLACAGLNPMNAAPTLLGYVMKGFIAECTLEDLDGIQTLRVCYRNPEAEPGTGEEASVWFDCATHALLRGELTFESFTVVQCAFSSFQHA